jgi:phosphopentomutase
LPDAAEFGDEGSNTLGNVARAVGGLDLPTLEALGLGNVEPLEGCAPQPGAPAIAGRLLERSKAGKVRSAIPTLWRARSAVQRRFRVWTLVISR